MSCVEADFSVTRGSSATAQTQEVLGSYTLTISVSAPTVCSVGLQTTKSCCSASLEASTSIDTQVEGLKVMHHRKDASERGRSSAEASESIEFID
jgi:hypothetical protein